MASKRLRLFAGPNGSGKTTIINRIPDKINLGFLINADDIETELRVVGYFNFRKHQIQILSTELRDFIVEQGVSSQKTSIVQSIDQIFISDYKIFVPKKGLNSCRG